MKVAAFVTRLIAVLLLIVSPVLLPAMWFIGDEPRPPFIASVAADLRRLWRMLVTGVM